MSQVVFKLPKPSESPHARKYQVQGYQANQHCDGRADNPYPPSSRHFEWWDQGWCEFELIDRPEPERTKMEVWLAGGND